MYKQIDYENDQILLILNILFTTQICFFTFSGLIIIFIFYDALIIIFSYFIN